MIHKVFAGQTIILIVCDCARLRERELELCGFCVNGFARSETIVVLIVDACTAANSQSRLSMRELQTSIRRSGYGACDASMIHGEENFLIIWTENHYEVSVKFFFFCCNVGLDASV